MFSSFQNLNSRFLSLTTFITSSPMGRTGFCSSSGLGTNEIDSVVQVGKQTPHPMHLSASTCADRHRVEVLCQLFVNTKLAHMTPPLLSIMKKINRTIRFR
jgi:hypothetical protein